MSEKVEDVMNNFGAFDCSQAIMIAWCEDYGLDKQTALKLSCGFAAGMSRLSNTCGAITGAYLVIGLKHGKYLVDDINSKEKTFKLIQEFDSKFVEKFGSTNCKELLGVDLLYGDPQLAKQQVQKNCASYVKYAAELLDSIL